MYVLSLSPTLPLTSKKHLSGESLPKESAAHQNSAASAYGKRIPCILLREIPCTNTYPLPRVTARLDNSIKFLKCSLTEFSSLVRSELSSRVIKSPCKGNSKRVHFMNTREAHRHANPLVPQSFICKKPPVEDKHVSHLVGSA